MLGESPTLNTCTLVRVFCELCFKNIFWKQAIKSSSSMLSKTQHYLTLSSLYQSLTILQNMSFFHICSYSNCCFLCAASKIAVFVYLWEVARAFSGAVYSYFCNALCKSLCIFHVPAVFYIKRVFINFAKFTENM